MVLRFSDDGPAFPERLVDALMNGEVVFLCGAGVSAPQLPGFQQLVRDCVDRLHMPLSPAEERSFAAERFEEVLGSVSRRLSNPDDMVADVGHQLQYSDDHDLRRHQTVLRLSRDLENRPTLVTTNFDNFFEHALVGQEQSEAIRSLSIAGQDLPPPGSSGFSGIIHLHGRIADKGLELEQTPLVLTSADYGDAYMRSGWASRFLFDLSRCKTIVLVGYRAGDAPVRYFLNVLAADRARFQDLRPVYALDGLDNIDDVDVHWDALAVEPIFFRYGTGESRFDALWRDLERLAELVERPRLTCKVWAETILTQCFGESSEFDRARVSWLLTGRGDLWSAAISSIEDVEWFDFFNDRKLWTEGQAIWILTRWIARDFRSSLRFRNAIRWRKQFGKAFGDEIAQLLRSATDLPDLWLLAWRLLVISNPDRKRSWGERAFFQRQILSGRIVFDADLRKAIDVLTPVLVLKPNDDGRYGWEVPDPPKRLFDLTRPDLTVFDSSGLNELVEALTACPETVAMLEIASARLRDTVGLASDSCGIQADRDVSDYDVPSIEPHEQNQHRDGPVFLVSLIARLLSKVDHHDRDAVLRLASAWRALPGRLGLRLWLHALRNPLLFEADTVFEALGALPLEPFWHVRREIALVLRDRAGDASAELMGLIEQRLLTEGETYYSRFKIDQGQPDWREHARDTAVWLRLNMLKSAGRLSDAGAAELQAIVGRRVYLDREVIDQDFFDSYMGPVQSIEGDPQPILDASSEDRLQVAQRVVRNLGIGQPDGWGSYCRVDPRGAYDTVAGAPLDGVNAPLWKDLVSALAFMDQEKRVAHADLVPRVFAALEAADHQFLKSIVGSFSDLFWQTERNKLATPLEWWSKLFSAAVDSDEGVFDGGRDAYGDAINSPAGRLTEALLIDIEKARSSGEALEVGLSAALRQATRAAGRQGTLSRAVLIHSAGFVVTIGEAEVIEHLDGCLGAEDAEGIALRAVLVGTTRTSLVTSRSFAKHILRAVGEPNDRDPAFVASKIILPAFSIQRGEHSAEAWGITQAQCEQALRMGPPKLREGAAKLLAQWIGSFDGRGAAAWRDWFSPLFANIWPRERIFRTDLVSEYLAELVIGTQEAFPEALKQMLPYLLPMQGHGDALFVSETDIAERFPQDTLRLLWRVFGPGSSSNAHGVPKILERLVIAHPPIEVDRRLQWLNAHASHYA